MYTDPKTPPVRAAQYVRAAVQYLKKTFGGVPEAYRLAGIPNTDMQTSATEGRRRLAERRAAASRVSAAVPDDGSAD